MASIFQVNLFNQLVSQRIASLPFNWNPKTGKYEFNLHHKYFKVCAAVKLICIFLATWSFFSDQSTLYSVIATVLFANSVAINFADDFLLYRDGEILALASTWVLSAYYETAPNLSASIQRRVANTSRTLILISVGIEVLSVSLGLGLTLADLDPLYQVLVAVSPDASTSHLNLARIPINVYIFLYLHITGQLIIWISELADLIRSALLNHLESQPLTEENLMFYKRIRISSIAIDKFHETASTHVLLTVGAMVVFGAPMLFLGIKLQITPMIFMGGPASAVAMITLQVILTACIRLYTESTQTIQEWGKQSNLKTGREKKYYRACVRALQPVSISIGQFGIFDDEIRGNYTENLVGYCVDITMTLSAVMT